MEVTEFVKKLEKEGVVMELEVGDKAFFPCYVFEEKQSEGSTQGGGF